MKRRTFLKNSVAGVGGLAGMACPGLESGAANGLSAAGGIGATPPAHSSNPGEGIGRPVRITSISFPNGLSVDEIAGLVDKAGSAGADVIALPELCRGQDEKSREDLHGPTVTAMSALAKKHNAYIVCPIDRTDVNRRLNTVVLLDRRGEVVCTYDKVFPYWSEYDVHPAADVGDDAITVEVKDDQLIFRRILELDPVPIGPAQRTLPTALPAKIAHHATHLLPRDADLLRCKLPTYLCLSAGRSSCLRR